MRFLHTMIRVRDLDAALDFFVGKLGLLVVRRHDYPEHRFSLVFLNSGIDGDEAEIELTWNHGQTAAYSVGRNFGHLAFLVEDIYEICERLREGGVSILRPPRDGRMAFVRSPDLVSVELLQKGSPLPPREPWASMPNAGEW